MPERSSSSVRVFYPRASREEVVRTLRAGVERLRTVLPLRRVVLFGSYAKRRHTVASDVDLLVVYAGEPRADAYALVRRTLGVRGLEPHLYTESEYRAAASTVDRMVAGGVELLSNP